MNKHLRAFMVTLVAVGSLALMTSSAMANRSISTGGGAVSATGLLTFGNSELARSQQIICSITLLRTLERVISKIRGSKIGAVTGVAIQEGPRCRRGELITGILRIIALRTTTEPLSAGNSSCREIGSGTILCDVTGVEPAWRLSYESFAGTLPRITSFNFTLERVRFKIEFGAFLVGLANCLYEGNVLARGNVEAGGAVRTGDVLLEGATLRLIRRLQGVCPDPARLGGQFTLNPAPRITLL